MFTVATVSVVWFTSTSWRRDRCFRTLQVANSGVTSSGLSTLNQGPTSRTRHPGWAALLLPQKYVWYILGRRALPSGQRAPESSTPSAKTGHRKNLTATPYPIDRAVLAAGRSRLRVVVIVPIILAVFLVFHQVTVFVMSSVRMKSNSSPSSARRKNLYAHRATRIALDRAVLSANRK